MPAERLSMRKMREVLRLKWALGLSARQVAGSAGLARSTVGEYLRRAEAAGLSWQEVETLTDGELDEKLFPPLPRLPAGERPLPDWAKTKQELRGDHVTLYLIWELCRVRHNSHSCASLLFAQGCSLRLVMEILGHSQIALTANTYTHLLPEADREGAAAMQSLFGGAG